MTMPDTTRDDDVLTETQLERIERITSSVNSHTVSTWGESDAALLLEFLGTLISSHRALQLRLDAAEQRAERYEAAILSLNKEVDVVMEIGLEPDPWRRGDAWWDGCMSMAKRVRNVIDAALAEQEPTDV